MPSKSLAARKNNLADPENQIHFLNRGVFENGELPHFSSKLSDSGNFPMKTYEPEVLQINMGYMCNQVCTHCHVDAGPDRKEIMSRRTLESCLDAIRGSGIKTVDLTGGAPEMNPHFRWFVDQVSKMGIEDLIVRSNLTIIRANRKYHDLPEFFREHRVHVISSLPFYRSEKTDRQRGKGVFAKSIEALKMLNEQGYGRKDSSLRLDLVYNPSGAFLPAGQDEMERDFKHALKKDFGVDFNQLFCITNLPISRFLEYLIASENYEDYMYRLVEAYNPAAVNHLMCRNTISVGWDGYLYDCDFNQMLHLKIDSTRQHIEDFNGKELENREVKVSQHCYGCTAGAGSSCQGSIV